MLSQVVEYGLGNDVGINALEDLGEDVCVDEAFSFYHRRQGTRQFSQLPRLPQNLGHQWVTQP